MSEFVRKSGSLILAAAFLMVSSACSQTDSPTVSSVTADQKPETDSNIAASSDSVGVETFIELLTTRSLPVFEENLSLVSEDWDEAYTPMLLEVNKFLRRPVQEKIFSLLEEKTGQKFGRDFHKWWEWQWNQRFEAGIDYAEFKARLYGRIDPSFARYFEEAGFTEIRLDEVVWGGVRRDGIPPLDKPAMLTAEEATYLSDSDVVFGINLNGDARCYPKRILAWHEMFKDTIGDESVCGVY